MQIRQLIAAGTVALLLSHGAMAATSKTDHCASLEAKFDKRAATSTSGELAKAKELREDGAKLCTDGKTAEGTRKLQEAVNMLGASKHK